MYGPDITNTGLWVTAILIGIAGYGVIRLIEWGLSFITITIG